MSRATSGILCTAACCEVGYLFAQKARMPNE